MSADVELLGAVRSPQAVSAVKVSARLNVPQVFERTILDLPVVFWILLESNTN